MLCSCPSEAGVTLPTGQVKKTRLNGQTIVLPMEVAMAELRPMSVWYQRSCFSSPKPPPLSLQTTSQHICFLTRVLTAFFQGTCKEPRMHVSPSLAPSNRFWDYKVAPSMWHRRAEPMIPVAMLRLDRKAVPVNPAEAGSLVLPAPSSCPGDLLQWLLRHEKKVEQSSLPRPGVSGLLVQSFQTSSPMMRAER